MVLTKLEEAGLVGRVVGANDRRNASLKLTPAGERMLERLAAPAQRAQERVLSAFSPQERKTFLDLLDKFAAHSMTRARAAGGEAPPRYREPRKRPEISNLRAAACAGTRRLLGHSGTSRP